MLKTRTPRLMPGFERLVIDPQTMRIEIVFDDFNSMHAWLKWLRAVDVYILKLGKEAAKLRVLSARLADEKATAPRERVGTPAPAPPPAGVAGVASLAPLASKGVS
jgi:hypothetical protein